MIDRVALANKYGWTKREIYKAIDAHRKLKTRQTESTITLAEYLDLMESSGLRPDMVGLRCGQYHLARYGDKGAYSLGNCRFIPQEQNQKERENVRPTPEQRKKQSEIAKRRERKKCTHCGGLYIPQMLARWHGNKCKHAH